MKISDLESDINKKDFKIKAVINKIKEQEQNFGREESGPQIDLFYGFLCIIYDGTHDISEIKTRMKTLFLSTMGKLVVKEEDIEEFIHLGRIKNYLKLKSNDYVELTESGMKYVKSNYYLMAVTSHWMHKFLTEKAVMIITALSLVILSMVKILFGISINSQGMVSEGLENFTDLIKIAIIYAGLRFNKDRIASILIILLMMLTGIIMIFSNLSALFRPEAFRPNIESYIIIGISILINYILMYYKGLVGRSSGNLSLLSDSKDSEINVLISLGVLVGLSFAIFKLYFVDPLIGLIIGILIIKEGYEFLKELVKKEEDLDITAIKVKSDNIYNNRLTRYLLASIRRERLTRTEILKRFKSGLELGRLYYKGYADFFYDELDVQTAEKYIHKLIKGGEIELVEGDLVLTPKGIDAYHEAESQELRYKRRHHKKNVTSTKRKVIGLLWAIFGIGMLILLILLTPILIQLLNSLIQSI
ncbi:MAG: hypothetical protein EU541_02405 [Promethearchaeota archaeon]|nr:MAG: hypothetical protein EU541_02405 [Candidatus Lokiarchaeota archaeon]